MDSSGKFYLLERPNPQDVQDRLWMMVLSVTKARDVQMSRSVLMAGSALHFPDKLLNLKATWL